MIKENQRQRDVKHIPKEKEIKISHRSRGRMSEILSLVFGRIAEEKKDDPILKQYLELEFQDMDEVFNH